MSHLEVNAALLFAVPLVRAPDQPVVASTSDLLSAAVVSLCWEEWTGWMSEEMTGPPAHC